MMTNEKMITKELLDAKLDTIYGGSSEPHLKTIHYHKNCGGIIVNSLWAYCTNCPETHFWLDDFQYEDKEEWVVD